jgi:hypothetical protein
MTCDKIESHYHLKLSWQGLEKYLEMKLHLPSIMTALKYTVKNTTILSSSGKEMLNTQITSH